MNTDGTERNQDATLFVGELDAQVTESLLWELFLQAGPVVNVHIPRDKVSNEHQSFGFVEFHSVLDADYAMKVMNAVRLFGRAIRVNKSNRETRSADIGANLFVGNLDHDVDEPLLQSTFAVFGQLLGQPKVMREPETGRSRGFAFVSYDSFEAADAAIATMNGQYIGGRPITVSFALKKDGKGERHGTETERMLAAQGRSNRPGGVPTSSLAPASLVPTKLPVMSTPAFNAMHFPIPGMLPPAGLGGPFAMPPVGMPMMPQMRQ